MARKKEDGDVMLAFCGLLGFVLLGIFLINTLCVFYHYDRKYNFKEASARVTDTWNFVRFGPIVLGMGCLTFFVLMIPLDFIKSLPNLEAMQILYGACVNLLIILALIVFPFLLISARLGTTQAGLLIYRQRGYFVIPTDWNKNTFVQNIFCLKIIGSAFTMESLELRGLTRITREGGKVALIHGNFGTRRIAWRTKQKRDECIAALENALGKRLVTYT